MATAIPARLSPAEGRKFGLTVGGAFLAIAVLLWWRGRGTAPYVGGLGALVVLAGLLLPTYLGPVQRAWMGLAHLISKVTTPIFMGVVYFLVISPVGLAMRLFGRDPMSAKLKDGGYWVKRADEGTGSSGMERQF